MSTLWYEVSIDRLEELMQQASALRGFTRDDIEQLVDSDLETPQLLEYLTAVMTHRMN